MERLAGLVERDLQRMELLAGTGEIVGCSESAVCAPV